MGLCVYVERQSRAALAGHHHAVEQHCDLHGCASRVEGVGADLLEVGQVEVPARMTHAEQRADRTQHLAVGGLRLVHRIEVGGQQPGRILGDALDPLAEGFDFASRLLLAGGELVLLEFFVLMN